MNRRHTVPFAFVAAIAATLAVAAISSALLFWQFNAELDQQVRPAQARSSRMVDTVFAELAAGSRYALALYRANPDCTAIKPRLAQWEFARPFVSALLVGDRDWQLVCSNYNAGLSWRMDPVPDNSFTVLYPNQPPAQPAQRLPLLYHTRVGDGFTAKASVPLAAATLMLDNAEHDLFEHQLLVNGKLAGTGLPPPSASPDELVWAHSSPRYPYTIRTLLSTRNRDTLFIQQSHTALMALALLSLSVGVFAYVWLRRRLGIEELLHQALRRDAFEPYLQPIVDGRDGQLAGAELLMRWPGAPEHYGRPDLFIPPAEQSGQIVPMTCAIMAKLEAALAGQRLPEGFYLSVNVVPALLTAPAFHARCASLAARLARDNARLVLEVTERQHASLDTLPPALSGLLDRYRITLAIDDFGTGRNNLATLYDCQRVSVLKIDRSFVDGYRPGDDNPLLDAVIMIGRRMGFELVGEGVADEGVRAYLLALGVHYHQGFLYGHPVPVADFLRHLGAHAVSTAGAVLPPLAARPEHFIPIY